MTVPCPTRVYFPQPRRLTAPPATAPSLAEFIAALVADDGPDHPEAAQ